MMSDEPVDLECTREDVATLVASEMVASERITSVTVADLVNLRIENNLAILFIAKAGGLDDYARFREAGLKFLSEISTGMGKKLADTGSVRNAPDPHDTNTKTGNTESTPPGGAPAGSGGSSDFSDADNDTGAARRE